MGRTTVPTQGERIAMVEVRLEQLEKSVANIDSKLDDLIALRYKGMGAFWLMSGLLGTGIVGAIFQFISWVRGN